MKIIKHGDCLRFTCPECQCIFQAVRGETGVRYREKGMLSGEFTYCASCPECGAQDVEGHPEWERGDV